LKKRKRKKKEKNPHKKKAEEEEFVFVCALKEERYEQQRLKRRRNDDDDEEKRGKGPAAFVSKRVQRKFSVRRRISKSFIVFSFFFFLREIRFFFSFSCGGSKCFCV
jgi:hypothetical protein|tara:strand:- start:120 stop:440 length:321 start_codon:yes stop_codon:yes gene_type:complete